MEKKHLKNGLWKSMLFFWLLLTAVFLIFLFQTGWSREETKREDVVALNEIRQLANQPENAAFGHAVSDLQEQLIWESEQENGNVLAGRLLVLYLLLCVFLAVLCWYIYRSVLKPFQRLEDFAGEVAAGNLEVPLAYERRNLFGAFTWAFDNMRLEIKRARSCEKAAIENNKTVIATISHDIKTPVASIRTYCEALQAGLAQTPERREQYLDILMKKCDEVSKLTNDLFLHSLSDLDKLLMYYEIYSARELIPQILDGITGQNERICLLGDIPECKINVDTKRLEQVYENLIANALKYAPDSKIEIFHQREEDCLLVTVRDYGAGIADSDLPFVFDKFYRGSNTADKQGAGLGLYIVRYIIGQFGGTVHLRNRADGLDAVFCLNIVKS